MKNTFCVIMAGGIGSRFWPRSRQSCPKQFLDILGVGSSLLQQTFNRAKMICPLENIFVVTSNEYNEKTSQQLPWLNKNNILGEPLRRNTTPCIAYACYKIYAMNPDANIVIMPSDHYIKEDDLFCSTINKALEFAKNNDSLLTIGIKPLRPETGYGYIQIDNQTQTSVKEIHPVKMFTEKPELEMAKVFLESGEFLWNSGIFVWTAKSIISAFKKYQVEFDDIFGSGMQFFNTSKEKEFIEKIYPECTSISIDYSILENADNVYVIDCNFTWSDLGTWSSLYENSTRDSNGNVVNGKNIMLGNSTGCIISTEDAKLTIVEGLKDYIVAQSNGMILIYPKNQEQNIKNVVSEVKLNLGPDFV